jgi:mutator protein MutT
LGIPGGKREPGETPEAALIRELHEELGIDVEPGAPLIAVPQRYPHKRLRLDVRRIATWRGSVKGHEGQALAWYRRASWAAMRCHRQTSRSWPRCCNPTVTWSRPNRAATTPTGCAPWNTH